MALESTIAAAPKGPGLPDSQQGRRGSVSMSRTQSGSAPWRIVHVDVGEPLTGLDAESPYRMYYVVFWYRGVALGHREVPAEELPLSSSRMASIAAQAVTLAVGDRLPETGFSAPLPKCPPGLIPPPTPDLEALLKLERPLAALATRLPGPSPRTPMQSSISVVVCTRNRPAELSRCLASLHRLSVPPREVLVVDNAPNVPHTREAVERFPGVRYVAEPRPGLSAARNAGIRSSTGDIIAFTDDDVSAHPDWVYRLEQAFREPRVMVVTGLVLPAELQSEAQVLFETEMGFNLGPRPRLFDRRFFAYQKNRGVHVWSIGAGANMAFRRSVAQRLGGFDERLGAGAAGCSEDSEFWYRVLADGGECRYEPAAAVFHHHRREMNGLERQSAAYMRGHVAALLAQFARYGHAGNLVRLAFFIPRHYIKRYARGVLARDKRKRRAAVRQMSSGLSGLRYWLEHRRLAANGEFHGSSGDDGAAGNQGS